VLEGALAHKDRWVRLDNRAGRRAAHERRPRRDAQRVQSRSEGVTHFFRSGSSRGARHSAVLRAEAFRCREKRGRLRLIASAEGADGSVTIHQDARIYAGLFDGAERAEHALQKGRRAMFTWRAAGSGERTVLEAGDALKTDAPRVVFENGRRARSPAVRLKYICRMSGKPHEKDSFGPIEVPADRLWGRRQSAAGASSAFLKSACRWPLIYALVQVKKAAARVRGARPAGKAQGRGNPARRRGGPRRPARRRVSSRRVATARAPEQT